MSDGIWVVAFGVALSAWMTLLACLGWRALNDRDNEWLWFLHD